MKTSNKVIEIQAEVAPEHLAFYNKLLETFKDSKDLVLGKPNKLSNGLVIDFPNYLTQKVEPRILDQKMGTFV